MSNTHAPEIETTATIPQLSLQKTPTAKALKLIEEGKITKINESTYLAIGSRDLTYEIKVANGDVTCQCEGFYFNHNCYHVKAAQILEHGVRE